MNEMEWFENVVTLIDSGLECSLNAVVDTEDNIMYIVEDNGEIEDFRNYAEAMEKYIRVTHKQAMKL